MSEEHRVRLREIIETDKVKTATEQDAVKQFVIDWRKLKEEIFAALQETEAEFLLEERHVEAKEHVGDLLLVAGKRPYELRFHPEYRKCQVAVRSFTPKGRDETLYPVEWLSKESVENLVQDFLAAAFRL